MNGKCVQGGEILFSFVQSDYGGQENRRKNPLIVDTAIRRPFRQLEEDNKQMRKWEAASGMYDY